MRRGRPIPLGRRRFGGCGQREEGGERHRDRKFDHSPSPQDPASDPSEGRGEGKEARGGGSVGRAMGRDSHGPPRRHPSARSEPVAPTVTMPVGQGDSRCWRGGGGKSEGEANGEMTCKIVSTRWQGFCGTAGHARNKSAKNLDGRVRSGLFRAKRAGKKSPTTAECLATVFKNYHRVCRFEKRCR